MELNRKLEILLVGNCDHQLLTNQVRNLKRDKPINFSAFSTKKISEQNIGLFQNVTYAGPLNNKVSGGVFWKLRYALTIIYRFLSISFNYDVVHINSLKTKYFFIWPIIRLRKKKVIISIWGSEFLRAGKFKRRLLGILWRKTDFIHCTNKQLKESVMEYFGIANNKIIPIPFILENLEVIEKIDRKKIKIKKELGWKQDSLQILVGYNYNEGQQHEKIIDQLSLLPKELAQKMQFIFPLTYGNSEEYRDNIISKASDTLDNTLFITSFMSNEKNSMVRIASDIFINVQITDQYSASMVESLYTGNIVITGSWLPYEPLKENHVYFIEIKKLEELHKSIMEVFYNYEKIKANTVKNKDRIKGMFDKHYLMSEWYELYAKAIN